MLVPCPSFSWRISTSVIYANLLVNKDLRSEIIYFLTSSGYTSSPTRTCWAPRNMNMSHNLWNQDPYAFRICFKSQSPTGKVGKNGYSLLIVAMEQAHERFQPLCFFFFIWLVRCHILIPKCFWYILKRALTIADRVEDSVCRKPAVLRNSSERQLFFNVFKMRTRADM